MRVKFSSFLIVCNVLYISKVKSVVLNLNETSSELLREIGNKRTGNIKFIDDNLEPESGIRKYTDDIYSTSTIFKNTTIEVVDEGSGDEELETMDSTRKEDEIESKNFNIVNRTTPVEKIVSKTTEFANTKFTTAKIISSSTFDVSSGDGWIQSTTEDLLVKTVDNTTKPTQVHEPIPENCILSKCDSSDAYVIISENSKLIPEGVNLTLTCVSNNSDHNMLYWFKYNGSDDYNLEAFGLEQNLNLNLPNVKSVHSGMYKCIKWINKKSCCNIESNLIIYEVPFYHYHLFIIGGVTAIFLITCIILVIRQSISYKAYSKQFSKKQESFKQQLL